MRRDLTVRERGQTIPFWTFATIAMLALVLAVTNYGTQVYWNVRAQNAADSAVATSVAVQANIWNEESTILYSAAVAEYRLRALNQGILNALNQNGGCDAVTLGGPLSCDTIFNILMPAFQQANADFQKNVQLLSQANQFTQGGQNAQRKDAQSILPSCTGNGNGGNGNNGNGNGGTPTNAVDPAFCYTVVIGNDGSNPLQQHTAAVIACRTVPYIAAPIVNLASPSFKAIATSGGAVATANAETVNVATYQPAIETQWYGQTPTLPGASAATKPYDVEFTNLTVNVNWYTATTLKPSLVPGLAGVSYACAS